MVFLSVSFAPDTTALFLSAGVIITNMLSSLVGIPLWFVLLGVALGKVDSIESQNGLLYGGKDTNGKDLEAVQNPSVQSD